MGTNSKYIINYYIYTYIVVFCCSDLCAFQMGILREFWELVMGIRAHQWELVTAVYKQS